MRQNAPLFTTRRPRRRATSRQSRSAQSRSRCRVPNGRSRWGSGWRTGARGRVDMKCDMAGAAAVLAGVQAVAELKLPVNVLGVLALVENMPSGNSVKLGDVLTARNGKTIEVLNTDAEGRLILADALCYASEQTDRLVDFATLTGACLVALGTETAGLMANDDAWADAILAAVSRA